MPSKFEFLSPGIDIREIDLSVIPPAADEHGPIIIGRTMRGPALKPIKIRSQDDLRSVFGPPVPGGGGSLGDIWREGPNALAPTYAMYAAQSWLASGNSPVVMVRLLGDQTMDSPTDNGLAGWNVSGSANATGGTAYDSHGTAYGLWMVDKANAGLASDVVIQLNPAHAGQTGHALTGAIHQHKLRISADSGMSTGVTTFEFDKTSNAPSSRDSANTYKVPISAAVNANEVAQKLSDALAICHTQGEFPTGLLYADNGIAADTISGTAFNTAATKVYYDFVDGSNTLAASVLDIDGLDLGAQIQEQAVATAGAGGKGALAAILYADKGFLQLKGTDDGGTPAQTGASRIFQSETVNKGFTIQAYNESNTLVDEKYFNMARNDSQFIRRVLNTNPTLVNDDIISSAAPSSLKTYWLGETFTNHLDDMVTGSAAGEVYAALVPLQQYSTQADVKKNWAYHKEGMRTASTGWFIAQNQDAASGYSPLTADRLFRVECLEEGQSMQSRIMITIEDLAFSPNPLARKYGTFTLNVRDISGNVLEMYSGLSLDSTSPDFIAKRIGDIKQVWDNSDRRYRNEGNYLNLSNYIRIVMYEEYENYPNNALPWGVLGPGRPLSWGFVHGMAAPQNAALSGDQNSTFAMNSDTNAGGHSDSDLIKSSLLINAPFEWPKIAQRLSGSDGGQTNPYKVMWGMRPKVNNTPNNDNNNRNSSLHDDGYVDYLRALPSEFASQLLDPKATDGFEHSYAFSLDDIVVNETNRETYWASGSHASQYSYTATGGQNAEGLVKLGVRKFAAPMFGGADGLDITEIEPFRNALFTGVGERDNYLEFTINKAIDSISDSEVVPANLLLAPGFKKELVTDKILSVCENRQDMLGIIDLDGDYTPRYERKASDTEAGSQGSISGVIGQLKARNLNTSFGCAFYPWVQVSDRINNGALVWVPPSVAAIGAMAQSEAASDVWFAPAGFNRGGLGNLGGPSGPMVTQARQRIDSSERDELYEVNINPIASFPNEGVVIFGQKTLQSTMSALDRINVRRLMLFLKSKITDVAKGILFDNNVQATWDRFLANADPILANVQARFGLTEYRLVLDETTTTPDLIDRNVLYAKVFLKPARAIEYIVIDFVITRSGADFA